MQGDEGSTMKPLEILTWKTKKGLAKLANPLISMVGARGFEPPTL